MTIYCKNCKVYREIKCVHRACSSVLIIFIFVCIKICSSDWSSIWTKTHIYIYTICINYRSAICFHCVRRHDDIMSLQKHFYYRRPTHFILSNHPFLYYWIFCTDSNVWAWIYNSQYMHIWYVILYWFEFGRYCSHIMFNIITFKKVYMWICSILIMRFTENTLANRWRKAKTVE